MTLDNPTTDPQQGDVAPESRSAAATGSPAERGTSNDRQRAFLAYKRAVAEHGKPFFPYGVWHDVIAAAVVIALIIALTVTWFAQANCDSYWNVSCNRVSTPLQQEQFTPDTPGADVIRDESGDIDHSVPTPVLGPLYESKADPATTSYHPRPEWYFYFLFYLLILISDPNLLILATIGLPTIWLVLLMAWPFLDRRRERRPSRRPLAMGLMVLTAITFLSFTWLGSQAGEENEGGPTGITPQQQELAGYQVLFEEGAYDSCASCHVLGGIGNDGPGPDLTGVGTRYDSLEELVEILAFGAGGGAMPPRGGAPLDDEQVVQVAAFLYTLGVEDRATEQDVTDAGADDFGDIFGDDASTEEPASETQEGGTSVPDEPGAGSDAGEPGEDGATADR